MTPVELISLMAAQLEAGDMAAQMRSVQASQYVDRALEIHTVAMFRIHHQDRDVPAKYEGGIDSALLEKLKDVHSWSPSGE